MGPSGTGHGHSLRDTLRRYCSAALIIALAMGASMMLIDLKPLGKGLILGALFSVFNFILMATALPMRISLGRRKSFIFSIGSIYLRYALMAIPLALSIQRDTFAISATAVGLFMVQLAILGDQLWVRLRKSEKVKC